MTNLIKRWTGLVTDAVHAFRPGWHWTESNKLPGPFAQFEPDVLQLGNEDWFLGIRLQPSGWQMGLIHDRKIIGSSSSNQFQVLFGIWSRMWASKMMLSRLQWERKYDWAPGKRIVVSIGAISFGPGGPFDNWRELAVKRQAEAQAAIDQAIKAKERLILPNGVQHPVMAALPGGKVPVRFLAYMRPRRLTESVNCGEVNLSETNNEL